MKESNRRNPVEEIQWMNEWMDGIKMNQANPTVEEYNCICICICICIVTTDIICYHHGKYYIVQPTLIFMCRCWNARSIGILYDTCTVYVIKRIVTEIVYLKIGVAIRNGVF